MSFEVAEDAYAQKNAGMQRVGVSFSGICLMMDAFVHTHHMSEPVYGFAKLKHRRPLQ